MRRGISKPIGRFGPTGDQTGTFTQTIARGDCPEVIDSGKSASVADTKTIFPSHLPERMALVDYVSPDEADGTTGEILEAYRDEHGESALFNEALATTRCPRI
jgi:hypothetical protein